MDEESKLSSQPLMAALVGMEARISARLEHIDGRLDRIDGRLDRIDGRLDVMDQRIDATNESLEAMETRLLSEFWKWGRTADARMRRVENSDATTVERITTLEERVFTLERRISGSKQ